MRRNAPGLLHAPTGAGAGVPPLLVVAAAWTPYLPLGWQYAAFLGCGLAAMHVLRRQGALHAVAAHPLFRAALLLWGWLVLSSAWSPAPLAAIASNVWTYSLWLWVTPIALAVDAADARRGLMHFVGASSAVALVVLLGTSEVLPASLPWRPFIDVTGNQRIAFSLLLAIGMAMALHLAMQAERRQSRAWLLGASMLCLAGLTLQDRRTGMLAMPVLLAALVMAHLRTGLRRAFFLGLIAVAAAAAVHWLPPVQQRFAEGVAELRAYHSEGDVTTSWGMRARMFEVTVRMAAEHPVIGHGVGSWVTQWRPRVAGSEALQAHTTPHNEYLLMLVQGGLVAWLAGLLLCVHAARGVVRHGLRAVPALIVLTALIWAGLFNVVLRDAKFALPLLMLAALAWGASTMRRRAPILTD